MFFIAGSLFGVSLVVVVSMYFGIWSAVLDAFSTGRFKEDMVTASRMTQYEQARFKTGTAQTEGSLGWFQQSEKLSERHREVFKEILNETNRDLALKLAILFLLIAWGSIYVSHKIAGPLYRFKFTLQQMRNGDFTERVHLRPGDEGQGLAQEFNQTLKFLDKKTARLKKIVRTQKNNPEELSKQLDAELSDLKSSEK